MALKKIKLNNEDNNFSGTNKDEFIKARGGDDSVSGGGGNDKIWGGVGDDTIRGGAGDDTIAGGEGDNTIFGGAGDDTITSNSGNDTIDGGEGDDLIKIEGNFADATVTKEGDTYVITSGTQTIRVTNAEAYEFGDETVGNAQLDEKADETGGGDVLTLTTAADSLDGSTAGDTFRAVTTASLQTEDVLDGGAGDDTLTIDDDGLAAGAAPIISNIETINNADADDFDLDQVTGVNRINQSVNDGVFLNASLATVFAAAGATSVDLDITYGDALTGTTDAVNLAVAFTADAQTVNFEFGAAAVAGLIESANIDVAAITGGGSSIVELDGDLDALTTITVTGAGDASIASDGFAYISEATFKTFNASAATGDIDTGLNGQEDVTVTFGAGDNQLDVTGTESGLSITTGAGSDLLVFADVANIDDATAAGFMADIVTITDFAVASDTLDISAGVTTLVTNNNADQALIEGAATLFAAITQAATDVAADEAIYFTYGGDAYIFVEDATDGFDAGDGLIKLTGVNSDALDGTNVLI